jgi:hypothetical protein
MPAPSTEGEAMEKRDRHAVANHDIVEVDVFSINHSHRKILWM